MAARPLKLMCALLALACGLRAPLACPRRVVAIGDVHADLSALRRALRLAGVIADRGESWTGGRTHVVQCGDLLDRGDDEFEVVELLRALRREARAAGGDVVCLLGNHEMMAVTGDLTFANPKARDGFVRLAPALRAGLPFDGEWGPVYGALSSDGSRCRAAAFRPGGPLARALAELSGGEPIVARRGDSLFVHGGLLPTHLGDADADADGGADAAAARVRALNDATLAWLRGDAGTPLALLGPDSPLWTRRFSSPARRPLARADDEAALEATLARLGGARMVVGHTPQMPGGVTAAAGRAVWRVDTGMCAAYGGPVEVLEILAREGAADDDGEADDAVVRVLTERGDVAASSRSV